MKAIPFFKVLHRVLILLVLSILLFSTFTQIAFAADSDGDGLSDSDEVAFNTEMNDPDTDDDGVPDGQEGLDTAKNELHEDNDPDGDGWNNARDADSDGDGILDGTEKGLTEADINLSATDQSKGHFFPDQDPATTTDSTDEDTDGDTLPDGDEDRNGNGKYEASKGETDPNFKDYDDDGLEDDTEDPDDDNDGMPDKFEKLFGLDSLDASDWDEDLDSDGFTNYREYLGNDNAPGNEDWSDPNDPTKKPNVAPVVTFLKEETQIEAKQKITFNETLLKVTDENEDNGLTFVWDWGDGSGVVTKDGVRPKKDPPQTHTYDTPGVYNLKLQIIDDIGNTGEATLRVDVTHPIGGSEIVIEIPRDKEEFKDKKTIQRTGWIAYKLIDVRNGDKVTIEFEVQQTSLTPAELGVRIFVIPKKNFNVYKNNNPTQKVISRKYEEFWSGLTNEVKSTGKLTIEAEEDDTLYVIFDNRFYEEGKQHIVFDEPIEYKVTITREESPVFIILLIVILLVVIFAVVIFGFFYYKTKKSGGVTKITREAAVETQRSLDREMAQLELEIQDSLRKSTVAAPMPAMSLQKRAGGTPGIGGAPGQPSAAAPGTVPMTPARAGAAGVGAQQPGRAPTGAAIPGSTPPGQPMLSKGTAPTGAPAQPGVAPGQQQQQMLPPAQRQVTQSPTAQSPTAVSPTAVSPTQKPQTNQ